MRAPGRRELLPPRPNRYPPAGPLRAGPSGRADSSRRPAAAAAPAGPMAPPGSTAPGSPHALRSARTCRGQRQASGRSRVPVRRQVVRRVSVWSVLKVSLIFYLLVLAVLVIAGVALWNVASDFGVINSLDKLVRSLFALTSFTLRPLTALAWGTAVGGGLCFLGVLVNVVVALLYNLISDVVGGVRVTLTADKDGVVSGCASRPGLRSRPHGGARRQ